MDGTGENPLDLIIETLRDGAVDGHIALADINAILEDVESAQAEETIDIATVLAAIARAGLEVDDEIDESELETESADAAKIIAADDSGSLDAYSLWQQMLNHRILSREQEIELSTRYLLHQRTARALYAAAERLEVRLAAVQAELETPDLDPAGRIALVAEAARLDAEFAGLLEDARHSEIDAQRAEETFISHNLRLVFALARRKYYAAGRRGDILDLVQQGNLGLIDAFRKFDPARGFKFSTYATWHVGQAISLWLYEQVGTLRVPTHRWRDNRKINQFRTAYSSEHGQAPSVEQIATHMNKTPKKINEILAAERLTRIDSLDAPLRDEDGSSTLGEVIGDPSALTPEQLAIQAALRTIFADAFERALDARERRVLMLRFGLEDDAPRTLEFIGRRMNVTRERVRQIEFRALRKLGSDEEIRTMRRLEQGHGLDQR